MIGTLPNRRNSPSAEIVWNGRRWRLQFGVVAGDVREIFVDPIEEGLGPEERLCAEWRSFIHDAAIDASLHLRAGRPAAEMAKRYERQRPSLLALMYAAAADAERQAREGMGA